MNALSSVGQAWASTAAGTRVAATKAGGEEQAQDDAWGGDMKAQSATQYRATFFRCNLLGSDRPDLQVAAKEA